jgi:hypothetical protein
MALAVPCIRLRPSVPVAADAESGDTMNVCTASDLEAADLLALARDEGGAPPGVSLVTRYAWPAPGR